MSIGNSFWVPEVKPIQLEEAFLLKHGSLPHQSHKVNNSHFLSPLHHHNNTYSTTPNLINNSMYKYTYMGAHIYRKNERERERERERDYRESRR